MTALSTAKPIPEFSCPVGVGDLEDGRGGTRHLSADADQRAALARRFDLVSLNRLEADIAYVRRGRIVEVSGQLTGDVTQTCVVTLEPMDTHIDESFIRKFDPDMTVGDDDEIDLTIEDLLDDDVCDPLTDETIDLGEVVAESLGLALDLYPRKDGAAIDPRFGVSGSQIDEDASPFAVLKKLKL